jgi:hypothetical protein
VPSHIDSQQNGSPAHTQLSQTPSEQPGPPFAAQQSLAAEPPAHPQSSPHSVSAMATHSSS